jgi:hypothetical protein
MLYTRNYERKEKEIKFVMAYTCIYLCSALKIALLTIKNRQRLPFKTIMEAIQKIFSTYGSRKVLRALNENVKASNAHVKIRLPFSERMFPRRYKEQENSVDRRQNNSFT